MDWQIRLVIIALGALLVGWVIWDFQRKKKKQAQQQRLIEQLRAEAESVDSAGFDATGVGHVRIKKNNENDSLASDELANESTIKSSPDQDTCKVEPVVSGDEQLEQSSGAEVKDSAHQPVDEEPKTAPPGISVNPEMVFSLILQAQSEAGFKGQDFMPLLLSQGLRHGEMGIFHRHQGSGGKPGPVIYSVANAVEPGYFDIQNIQMAQTPAFALFMTLPGPEDPRRAYESMVRTGRLLEKELDGKLLDQNKSSYSEQTHQHQLEQIQAWINQHQQ